VGSNKKGCDSGSLSGNSQGDHMLLLSIVLSNRINAFTDKPLYLRIACERKCGDRNAADLKVVRISYNVVEAVVNFAT